LNDTRLRVLAAVLAVVIAVPVTIAIIDNGPDHEPGTPRRTITVQLGGPGHKEIPLAPAAQAQVHQQAKEDAAGQDEAAESDLHESPAQLPTDAAQRQADARAPPGQPQVPQSTTQASPSEAGCSTALVRNYSSRRGNPVLLGVIHWTGSRPLAGSTADGLAIVRWFDTPAAQASSNYITDDDGHCWLTVAEANKAWTQAAFNSWSVSDEHVNAGVQPFLPTTAGRRQVVRFIQRVHSHWKIPYRRAQVTQAGCRVLRSGFLAHRDLGACGGGHPDVGSFNLDGLIAEAARTDPGQPKPVTSPDRVTCRKLNWWRTHGRPKGKAEANAVRRREALGRRHVTCTSHGPVRR
jgi:hypothetical protein